MNIIKVTAVIAAFTRLSELGHPFWGMAAAVAMYNLFTYCFKTIKKTA